VISTRYSNVALTFFKGFAAKISEDELGERNLELEKA
jgi:hypothetical protein